MKSVVLLFFILIVSTNTKSQDVFQGRWSSHIETVGISSGAEMTLEIGQPEKNLLYPAQLTLTCDSFTGKYQLLLVKKTSRQLAVSTQKYAVQELPFSIGNQACLFSGLLDFNRDAKGNSMLLLERLKLEDRKTGLTLPDLKGFTRNRRALAEAVSRVFESEDIELKKATSNFWSDSTALRILQPRNSPAYFGIIDTIYAKNKMASLKFLKNSDNDIVTIKLNGAPILEQIDSKKERDDEDFLLDTGLNILVFYADDFGKSGGSSAAVNLVLDNYSKTLDFREQQNAGANFIVAKIFLKYDEGSATRFETYNGLDNQSGQRTAGRNPVDRPASLNRTGKLIGSIVAKSRQLTFAIWDDAVEDGDTISLSINDKWITQNFPVLKKPQFITVTLEPGPNVITFVAENLGSIIPNTSVLEIIDGNKRQSFYIETDMNQNNQIRIFYDLKKE